MSLDADSAVRPRILFFSPYRLDDVRSGGERRTALFHAMLRECGCEVDTIVHARPRGLPAPDDPAVRWLPIRNGFDRFFDWRLVKLVRARLRAFRPDVLWVEQFYTGPLLAYLARRAGVKVVYNAQNVEAERFAAWSRFHQALVRRYEDWFLKHADWTIAVSERDRTIFSYDYKVPLEKLAVIPNGYDDAVFFPKAPAREERAALWRAHGLPDDAFVAVFPGNQQYAPNLDARHWIENTLAPTLDRTHPRVHFVILGPDLPDDAPQTRNLHPVGFVKDLPHYLRAADVLICPLSFGSGSRLKIIEALACGVPVIATPKGAEGIEDLREPEGLYRVPLDAFAATLGAAALAPPARHDDDVPPKVAKLGKRNLLKLTGEFLSSIMR